MSKLVRALTLLAMLAAMNLAGMTAHAHTSGQLLTTDQPNGQPDAIVGRVLARERSSTPHAAHPHLLLDEERSALLNLPNNGTAQAAAVHQRLLAQERYYSTWDYGDTATPAPPPEPSGQAGWLTPALAVLSAVLALVAGGALVVARRAHRSQRAGQTA